MENSTMIALRTLIQAFPAPRTFEITGFFLRGDYRPDWWPLVVAKLIVPVENDHSIARYQFADGTKELLDAWEAQHGPAIWAGPLESQDQRIVRFLMNFQRFRSGDWIGMTAIEFDERLDGFNRAKHSRWVARMMARGLLIPMGHDCYKVTDHFAAMCRELQPADWETLAEEERRETKERQESIFNRAK